MEKFQPILLAHLAFGPLVLLIALLFQRNSPKRINAFYGYRTSRSMTSQVAWDEANAFSAQVMVFMALAVILYQIVSQLLFGFMISFQTSGIFLAISQLAIIPITELHLRSLFDQVDKSR
jgi:uncharacterized membrane protein